MAQALKQAFADARRRGHCALVSFLTAGFPTVNATVLIMKAMQDGGTDIIELGMPFSDPMADGPVIQKASKVALQNGVRTETCLDLVRTARAAGVQVPIVLMGYYNPIYCYGDARFVDSAKSAGANGFIVVDLPPEECQQFRELCANSSLSYIPLVAPSTTDTRLKVIAAIADSFVYVVSQMNVTGKSISGQANTALPQLCQRVRTYMRDTPIAVGFGVRTKDDFLNLSQLADGVVIGSRIVEVIDASSGDEANAVFDFCRSITGGSKHALTPGSINGDLSSSKGSEIGVFAELDTIHEPAVLLDDLSSRIGGFGGSYVPEAMIDCLNELETEFKKALHDESFWEEFRSYYPYMGRPSQLQYADRLTTAVGGAKIWLKREDLNHTGSHKINNALGQMLIAKRLNKTRVIAETGAGQHGVATATVAAKFGMKCLIYMGAEDVRRQALNVFRMKLLGAEVVTVESGSKTLRDAVNEALRAWVTDLSTTHYIIGSAIGPHPFPTIVRTFQSVIGQETKEQFLSINHKLPDALVACVGGGSNSIGLFYPFAEDSSVQMYGIEAGGDGIDTERHSATLTCGRVGVLHGVRTYVLQDASGQVRDTHSISAGLDYPGVGPHLSYWKDTERVKFSAATDAQAFEAFQKITELEGIIPALESAHAIYGGMQIAKSMKPDQNIVISLSGRGDKDIETVIEKLPVLGPQIGWDLRF